MKGIELAIQDDGQLAIRCLEHNTTHTGSKPFCCNDVMVRAMSLGIQKMPESYRARMMNARPPQELSGLLFDIATAPLLAFNTGERGNKPIET
jgi:hypothetical protein